MSVSHRLSWAYDDGGTVLTKSVTVTAGQELNLDEAIPDSSADLAVAFAFARAKLQALFILSDRNVTICTNDDSQGSPQETITLTAGVPFVWHVGDPVIAVGDVFAGDVTGLFVTNASGASAQLQIRAIIDPT